MASKNFKKIVYGLLAQFLLLPSVLAEKPQIAILAPSTNQELSNTFELIIDGIKQKTPQFEKKVRLLSDNNKDEIKQWINSNKFLAIVTIGNKTTELADSLSSPSLIIRTGTLLPNNRHHNGVFLSIADDVLKKTLRLYLPHIKTLHIGTEGRHIIWFTDNQEAPQIVAHKIGSEQKAIVQFLWKTINHANPKTEAVWVNNNIEHLFLYKLSERAWERNVTLISNDVRHLESGILLAIYPDFERTGQKTGELLTAIIKQHNQETLKLEPLRAIHKGINLRAARHLGIIVPPIIENDFRVIIE